MDIFYESATDAGKIGRKEKLPWTTAMKVSTYIQFGILPEFPLILIKKDIQIYSFKIFVTMSTIFDREQRSKVLKEALLLFLLGGSWVESVINVTKHVSK